VAGDYWRKLNRQTNKYKLYKTEQNPRKQKSGNLYLLQLMVFKYDCRRADKKKGD
jgi:hypothetical protein